jgi:hypothetical protein
MTQAEIRELVARIIDEQRERDRIAEKAKI